MTQTSDQWEQHASWWQDNFTEGVDPEYTEQILPMVVDGLCGARTVLDIGTGEGQVGRALVDQLDGIRVIGVDPSGAQLKAAVERSADKIRYLQAGAGDLPFGDGSFDAAVACLVFEHIDELDEAIREVARVVATGGKFLLLLNHPLLQTPGSGWIDDQILDPPEQYWRVGPYLNEAATTEEVQKDVHIRFLHRPLSRYINSMIQAGFELVEMIEPAPPNGFLAQAPQYEDAATIPRLLVLRTRRKPRESTPGSVVGQRPVV